jgi:hypothetical protein
MDAKRMASQELLSKYINKEDNLINCQKIFIANSFIRWIEENSKDDSQFAGYLKEVARYLDGEIDLYWEKGSIKIKKLRKS